MAGGEAGGLEAAERPAAEAGDEQRRVVDGDRPAGAPAAGQGPLRDEGLGEGRDPGDPVPGQVLGQVDGVVGPRVQTSTRPTSSRSTSRFQSVSQAGQPSLAAAAATAAWSRPQMAAIRGRSGRSKKLATLRQAWEWARPMNA